MYGCYTFVLSCVAIGETNFWMICAMPGYFKVFLELSTCFSLNSKVFCVWFSNFSFAVYMYIFGAFSLCPLPKTFHLCTVLLLVNLTCGCYMMFLECFELPEISSSDCRRHITCLISCSRSLFWMKLINK